MFRDYADPVGVAHKIDAVETKLDFYKRLWDSQWSRRRMWVPKVGLSRLTNFLMVALDDFVVLVSEVAIPGHDKKATVLEAVDRLYEYTVREALPIWLRPIAAPIKNYVVYVLASNAIDWMVTKYKSGSWKAAETSLDRALAVLPPHKSCRRARRRG